jgi:nicotinamidase-related amidase
VIDLQKGITAIPGIPSIDDTVQRSAALAAAFRRHGLPVVLVNVTGGPSGRTDVSRPAFTRPPDWADIIEDLDQQPDDLLVTKQTWGAFHGTPLDALLRDRGVTQIVLTGVSTSAGVESTARSAHEHGYHVVLATDAMTDRDDAAHEHSIQRIFPRLGETATTDDVLAMLDKTR